MRNDQSVTVRRPVITAAPLEAVRHAVPEPATRVEGRTLPAQALPGMGYEAVRDALEPGWREADVGTFLWHIRRAKAAQAAIFAAKGGAR